MTPKFELTQKKIKVIATSFDRTVACPHHVCTSRDCLDQTPLWFLTPKKAVLGNFFTYHQNLKVRQANTQLRVENEPLRLPESIANHGVKP